MRIAKTLSAYLNSLSTTDTPPSKEQLEELYLPDIDPDFVRETQTLISAALLLGMDHASRKIDAADEEIPPLPFEEAVSFMKSRIPMTKAEWNALEPKLRFRAFTVARLTQVDYIEAARGRLVFALEKGEGYASTWHDIKAIAAEDGTLNFWPGYWENVYRTNTQTAYTAGKLMQFKDNPPPAWRLLIIDDSRTSDICRGLMRDGKQSLTMASDHPFWETFGFPPYHFQCRTGLQAVYKSEIADGAVVENPNIKDLQARFNPMKGFGGNPLDKESWWKMTDAMIERAAKRGILPDIQKQCSAKSGILSGTERLEKYKTLDDLAGYAREEWGVKTVNLDGLDASAIKGTFEAMETVFNEWPELRGQIMEIGQRKVGIMSIGPIRDSFVFQLNFNPGYYNNVDNIKALYAKMVEAGRFPKGTDWKNAGVHELGHLAHGVIAKNNSNYEQAWQFRLDFEDNTTAKGIVNKAWKNVKSEYTKGARTVTAARDISGYADFLDRDSSHSETVAEAFSDVFSNKDKARPLSREIVRLLKEMLK